MYMDNIVSKIRLLAHQFQLLENKQRKACAWREMLNKYYQVKIRAMQQMKYSFPAESMTN